MFIPAYRKTFSPGLPLSKIWGELPIEIISKPTLLKNGTKVDPAFGMPGKGNEFMTTNPVHVNIINWQPIR